MGLRVVHCEAHRHDGLSTEPGVVHSGRNSGYQLINLAWLRGYRRLLLLGYDLQRTGGKAHWFGEHPTPEMRATSIGPGWIEPHDRLAAMLGRYDLDIINCTRETALTCYPRMPIDQALA